MNDHERRSVVVEERPVPGTPRQYEFPAVERAVLPNGLSIAVAHMPGRGLVSASLVLRNGAGDEPAERAGATVLSAKALTEGTETRDAIELIEASERLGASIHAEAGWDATTTGVDVPASRLADALALVAEVVRTPAFPPGEVNRLREERLNDLLQAKADPRRRAEEAFAAAVYAASSPYHRPSGGPRDTVERLDAEIVRALHLAAARPEQAALVVAGDVDADEVFRAAETLFGDWTGRPDAPDSAVVDDSAASTARFLRVVHRPGSVQTELRVGHPGLPRRHADFHAISVMGAILGGLFNSRLNMKLREEKGYTYGASAGFELRRARGPFAARAAVNTEATVPALMDMLAELDRIREAPVTAAELKAARDFLVGVFPLRFETSSPVAGALAGLFVHRLPDDELARYRTAIESVTSEDVLRVAREHIRPDEAAIVLVGDLDAFGSALEAAGLGSIEVERDAGPTTEGPILSAEDEIGPVDSGEPGPTAGADEPDLPGTDEPADPGDSTDAASLHGGDTHG
jgi:zinc protease